MHPRTGVNVGLAILAVMAPLATAWLRPDLLGALTWAVAAVAALVAVVAALRSTGSMRAGWFCMALAMLADAYGNLMFTQGGGPAPVGASAAYAGSAQLLVLGLLTFGVTGRRELPTSALQAALAGCALWLLLWHLDPQALLTGHVTPGTPAALMVTAGLGGTMIAAFVSWLVVVPAHLGRSRAIQALLGLSILAALAGDVLTLAAHSDGTWTLCQVLWVLQPALALGAAALVALRPAAPPTRTLLAPYRDLVVVSLFVVTVVLLVMATMRPAGLDTHASQALCVSLLLLVGLHVHERWRGRQLASEAEEQARHMKLLVSETRDIIIELDPEGRVLFASAAMSTILGLRGSELGGKHISDVLPDVSPDVLSHLTYAPSARMQSTLRLESAITTATAAVVHVESVITPMASGFLVAVRDVTERVGLQSRLQQVTYRDVVTGLPNRSSLDRQVRHRLYEAASGEIFLLLVDIAPAGLADNTIGDDSREELLRTVARTMRGTLRPDDLLARFSDQRFAVLLAEGTPAHEALAQAHRLVDAVNRPDLVPDVTLRASGGLTLGGHTGLELVRNAELALRQASREGPGAVQIFEPTMLAQFARTRNLRRRLAHTPGTDRWTVLYQPIVNLRLEQVTGVEALLRWTDPEGDFIGIEEVIGLAEEFGSIIPIGTWVLEQAVAQARAWNDGGRRLTVAVNISVHQLVAPGFAATVQEILDASQLPPELLILEITETVVLEQTEETIATLEELRTLGIRVAIDDFGTGYSGLANLRSLPLDILKIDRTFVQGLGESGGDEAVVAAVSRLGRELGLTITAEGIETRAQEARARMLGITAAQGYLYARPLPPGQIGPLADQLAGGGVALEL
ncbi:putative bifunctional diguanylate cyclase/phosphodiesterase [Arsenicicoccus dermatophilus]|uniref:putative bifunctional diguanylate cyclase/phosphodiesterase n=1 Tax=Arsenicicoccus dermatophilus TaxID=1076331 RepID=UPI00391712DA